MGSPTNDCCSAQGIYATIANYLSSELRYMDAEELRPKACSWAEGTPGHR
jgi:hypothetical protein